MKEREGERERERERSSLAKGERGQREERDWILHIFPETLATLVFGHS